MNRSLEAINAALDFLAEHNGFEVRKGTHDCQTCTVASLVDDSKPWAFYHMQDAENWDEDGEMRIGFGPHRIDGEAVLRALMAHDLFVRWDWVSTQRIAVRE